MYPDVNFVLIDGNPHNADYSEFRTNENAVGIVFAEEQAGFLAGYAAVKDGYTKLGFMGGMAVPAALRLWLCTGRGNRRQGTGRDRADPQLPLHRRL